MAFVTEWIKGQDLWETKSYGKYDAVNYVRVFLGDDQVYVAAKDVLFFETFPGCYRVNPFIKQAMDAIHYNEIEIIAYDDGSLGEKEEYQKILKKCGYSYIDQMVLATEFKMRHINYKFYTRMIQKYNLNKKKYGVISKHVNLFAKKQKVDHLLYTTPEQYPGRYCYGKHLKADERMFERFVNESLFQGYVKESKGYYFGYAFEGIFIDSFCRFIKWWKEKEEIDRLYFPYNISSVAQVYSTLYPEDHTDILYADEKTKRNVKLLTYLNHTIPRKSAVIDLSLEENFTKYIKENMENEIKTLNLYDFFSRKDGKKYEKDIKRMTEMIKDPGFLISEYDQGLAVWTEDEFDMQKMRNFQEIQKGTFQFSEEFHACREKRVYEKNDYEMFDHKFVLNVITYAFNEKKRNEIHKTFEQKIMQSAKIRKVIQKTKKQMKKLKGAF